MGFVVVRSTDLVLQELDREIEEMKRPPKSSAKDEATQAEATDTVRRALSNEELVRFLCSERERESDNGR